MSTPAPEAGRYDRQCRLPGIGDRGQARLAGSRAVIVGCGALGSVIAETLTRAGVGQLRIIDRDVVEWSNLQRQVLFDEDDARECRPKAVAAQRRLREINSSVEVEAVVTDFRSTNAVALVEDADCLLDGLDNLQTRYLLNDLAVRFGLPYIYGGAVATYGACLTILPLPRHRDPSRTGGAVRWTQAQATGCLRCTFPEPPPAGVLPTCETAGVLASVVLSVAAHQSAEAIKLLSGNAEAIDRTLLSLDLWRNETRRMHLPGPVPGCPCCAEGRMPYLDEGVGEDAIVLCGRDAVQVLPPRSVRGDDEAAGAGAESATGSIDLEAMAARLADAGEFVLGNGLLRGVLRAEAGAQGREIRLMLFGDGRAIIHGCGTPGRARAIYARYIGT